MEIDDPFHIEENIVRVLSRNKNADFIGSGLQIKNDDSCDVIMTKTLVFPKDIRCDKIGSGLSPLLAVPFSLPQNCGIEGIPRDAINTDPVIPNDKFFLSGYFDAYNNNIERLEVIVCDPCQIKIISGKGTYHGGIIWSNHGIVGCVYGRSTTHKDVLFYSPSKQILEALP